MSPLRRSRHRKDRYDLVMAAFEREEIPAMVSPLVVRVRRDINLTALRLLPSSSPQLSIQHSRSYQNTSSSAHGWCPPGLFEYTK
jgi:hypothetical protein